MARVLGAGLCWGACSQEGRGWAQCLKTHPAYATARPGAIRPGFHLALDMLWAREGARDTPGLVRLGKEI